MRAAVDSELGRDASAVVGATVSQWLALGKPFGEVVVVEHLYAVHTT